jgi:hypothetical protein
MKLVEIFPAKMLAISKVIPFFNRKNSENVCILDLD